MKTSERKVAAAEVLRFHPRNRHQGEYDFDRLVAASPELKPYVQPNAWQVMSIDFADPRAVVALNRALLQDQYGIRDWALPDGYLCPPVPGRADYLHALADLLAQDNDGRIPIGDAVRVLDVGVGANAIYPLIGRCEYGWAFVGADIDVVALENAARILASNPDLASGIELRRQPDAAHILAGIIRPDDRFDLTLCNPPFHASAAEAHAGSRRKWRNLGRGDAARPVLNFGGQANELYCPGGEPAFIRRMIAESQAFQGQVRWFTTLVSRADNLPAIYRLLRQAGARQVRTVEMRQGQKQSRFVAWTFGGDRQRSGRRAGRQDVPDRRK